MAFAIRTGRAAPLLGHCRPCTPSRASFRPQRRLAVAAVEPSTYQPPSDAEQQPELGAAHDQAELQQQLTLQQLDDAQENLLKWMLFLDSDAQEADLDEAVDQEDVGDEEFEELYDEVEAMLEETEASFKVGDKVYGTVYEVDEDGASVEIGAKTAGFVPLVECSLGKLKTVSRFGGMWRVFEPSNASAEPLTRPIHPPFLLRSLWRCCARA
jgi:hypothetical protein